MNTNKLADAQWTEMARRALVRLRGRVRKLTAEIREHDDAYSVMQDKHHAAEAELAAYRRKTRDLVAKTRRLAIEECGAALETVNPPARIIDTEVQRTAFVYGVQMARAALASL